MYSPRHLQEGVLVSSFAYGERKYSQGFYGGRADHPIDLHRAVVIEVFDPSGARKGAYQTGSSNLLSVTFSHDEAGCRDFSLSFSSWVDIDKRDTVRIRLFDNEDCFFRGVVRSIPIDGSTKREFSYVGFGLVDYLSRVTTDSQDYTGDTIEEIILDLIDTVVTVKTPITKNATKIVLNSVITVTEVVFKYESCMDAFKTLQDIANSDGSDYVYGVDAEGDFFFRPRSNELKKTLVVGKRGRNSILAYEPEDSYEAKSALVVLKKDGTYYATYTSTKSIDIFEEKLTAPDIADADIDNWANGQLLIKEQETREASIQWEIERVMPTLLFADGLLRIISQTPPMNLVLGTSLFGTGPFGSGIFGGNQYDGKLVDDTLKIKEVEYKISGDGALRSIQLGSIPARLDRDMIEIHKDVKALRTSLGR